MQLINNIYFYHYLELKWHDSDMPSPVIALNISNATKMATISLTTKPVLRVHVVM